MNTNHRWFHSGEYTLLGHVDLPERVRGTRGVVIVPSFGWEDVCSYRPLRFLAETLAGDGIPTLRFDLPGTGDSSGDARDPELFEAWIRSVGDAAEELRRIAGVNDVAVLGIRLGALLALSAAAQGANLQDLILWGPTATGKAFLRELNAFSRMARAEYANGAATPPSPFEGLEIGGFLLAPETQHALSALDFSTLPPNQVRRCLVLTRDILPADQKLVATMESSGWRVETREGSGYAGMLSAPDEAVPPLAASQVIIDFLKGNSLKEGSPRQVLPVLPADAPVRTSLGSIRERIYMTRGPNGPLFGILSEPAPAKSGNDCCILLLNAGGVRHIGPNRMWVEAARRWAARGFSSLRLDLESIGESQGEANLDIPRLYGDRLVEQVEMAIADLRAHTGARQFVAVGLCSGAFWAFQAALRNRDVRLAILLNPRLLFWDPEVDRRRVLKRAARLLTDGTDWARLFRGHMSFDSCKRVVQVALERFREPHASSDDGPQVSPEGMAQAWQALERNQNRLTMIFTEGEPLLRELEEEGHLAEARAQVRCIRVANCGHTFRPLWAQQMAHQLIDREIDEILREDILYPDRAAITALPRNAQNRMLP